jgi:inorganic pyrophosphatase
MSLQNVPIGDNAPDIINAVIEIPARTSMKYEYDEEFDVIRLDRVLHSPMFYPADYGFIPHTRAEDGDHLDVLVLISQPIITGCVVEVRPVGILDMEDNAGIDWKILAVPTKDSRYSHITHIDHVNQHLKDEIQHFFEQYKHLENKWAKVRGWLDVEEAHKRICEAQERFEQEG